MQWINPVASCSSEDVAPGEHAPRHEAGFQERKQAGGELVSEANNLAVTILDDQNLIPKR